MFRRQPRIVIESFPNSLVRVYHLNVRLISTHDYRLSRANPFRPRASMLSDDIQLLISALYMIEGVLEVEINPYDVTVAIATAFDWDDDVQPNVIFCIKQYLNWQHKTVDVRQYRDYVQSDSLSSVVHTFDDAD